MEIKLDYHKIVDFSTLKGKPLELDDINAETLNPISNAVEQVMKEQVKIVERAYVESMVRKAVLYDMEFNPYTVTERTKREMIRHFCSWLLSKIKDDGLTKKQTIELIEKYSKE